MPEPNHAQEHHLRMAVQRALRHETSDFSSPESLIATAFIALGSFTQACVGSKPRTREQFADGIEKVAGLLLRASVWLRRSNS